MTASSLQQQASAFVAARAKVLFAEQRRQLFEHTDRLFVYLMLFQWIAGVAIAVWVSPRTWAGQESAIHPHIWAALGLGGVLTSFPVYLALTHPGEALTRHTVAVAQMLMSALLIHLTGGRIETHFHVFGSLAFLAFYFDWRVLLTASLVVVADHLTRGLYFPRSVYGVLTPSGWRVLEHTGWVIFEDLFLVASIRYRLKERWRIAVREAELEQSKDENARLFRKAQESAAQTRRLIESSFVGMVVSNFDGRFEDANDAFLSMVGYTRDDLRSGRLRWDELTPPEYQFVRARAARELREKGFSAPTEKEYIRKDGSRVPVLLGSALLRDSGHNNVTYVLDITDRKRAEEEVKSVETRQRAFLRDVLFSVTEGKLRLCDNAANLPQPLLSACGTVPLTKESLGHLRRQTQRAAVDSGFPAERWHDLITAVSEAGMNAVVHGGGGEGHIFVSDQGTVQVRIEDRGTGIKTDTLHRATLERGFTTAGSLGHGFWLMLKTADRLWLQTSESGTTVVIEQDREQPEPGWLLGSGIEGMAA